MKRLCKLIIPSVLLLIAASTLPVLGRAKKNLPPTVTNAQVKHYSHLVDINLKKNDLAGARRAMDKAVFYASFRSKIHMSGASSHYILFFPEGEARRCFVWSQEDLRYYELRKSSVALIWEAGLGYSGKNNDKDGGEPLEGQNPVTRYYKSAGYRVGDQFGSEPVINKPMVFFDNDIPWAFQKYGHIALDGNLTYEPGRIDYGYGPGWLPIEPIPGEKIQSPKSAPSAK